jgi:hypothetical protein
LSIPPPRPKEPVELLRLTSASTRYVVPELQIAPPLTLPLVVALPVRWLRLNARIPSLSTAPPLRALRLPPVRVI